MDKTNFFLAAVMSAAVSIPAHASPAAPSGARQAPSPRHVQPVLPSASRGIMPEAPWPTTGQAWTRLDRDMDLRVKRMTPSELEAVMAQAESRIRDRTDPASGWFSAKAPIAPPSLALAQQVGLLRFAAR